MKIMYLVIYIKFEFSCLLVTADLRTFCLLRRESLQNSLSLVKSEPILTWVLSKPEFGFYSGLSFLNLISGVHRDGSFSFFFWKTIIACKSIHNRLHMSKNIFIDDNSFSKTILFIKFVVSLMITLRPSLTIVRFVNDSFF